METMSLAENSGREGGIEKKIKCEIIIGWGEEWTRELSEIVRQPMAHLRLMVTNF